jgi:hypothetical protein
MTSTRTGSRSLLVVVLACAVTASACGRATADAAAADVPLNATPASPTNTARAINVGRAAPTEDRELTIPAGTALSLSLTDAVASETSDIEDPVTAQFTRAVVVNGREAIPEGATVAGTITGVDQSGRVRGRAMVAFRFTTLRIGAERYPFESSAITREAAATKGEDATKIGIGAGAGAVIGTLLGGKKGAAEGAAIGGGAGTGVVLATKGKEIRLEPGVDVSTALTAPLSVRVSAR